VRETLFNWLGQDLTGLACLDLYAGSGALGFEAASRGARRVVLVERERAVATALQASCEALQAGQTEVVRADALEFLRTDGGVYDVVFLDPPFATQPWPEIFRRLPARLAPGARVHCESGAPLEVPSGFELLREGRAGQVSHQLLRFQS
jgi:16S rRNA (guanine966-N2)-methyltransferase